jgi:protein required for attachment to host cells
MSHDWLLVSNASHARIFKVTSRIGQPREMQLIHSVEHPQSRMKMQDLTSDKPGIYRTQGFAPGGHAQDIQNTEMQRFAKELADIIDHARTLNRFGNLVIVAPPHFYGLLDKQLSGSIKHLIKRVIQKDFTGVVERDLQRLIFPKQAVPIKTTERS